jgi:hypothetical protein
MKPMAATATMATETNCRLIFMTVIIKNIKPNSNRNFAAKPLVLAVDKLANPSTGGRSAATLRITLWMGHQARTTFYSIQPVPHLSCQHSKNRIGTEWKPEGTTNNSCALCEEFAKVCT